MPLFARRPRAMIAAVALLLVAPPLAAQDIGGLYLVEGLTLEGQAYTGEAEIALTSEVTCEIAWRIGEQDSFGICMRMGDAFAVAHETDGVIGLAIYAVMPDGTLAGTWTIAGIEAVGKEVLTPQ
jgi:hypothetical protein